MKHGAHRNANDESTAFGSLAFELTSVTQPRSNQHASDTFITGRGGKSVPGEVAILCQEICEV